MGKLMIPLILFMIVMLSIIGMCINVAIKKKKHLKQLLPTDIDIIIKRGDYYESTFYEFIKKKIMSDSAFDKSIAFDKDGKPTRYFTSNINDMYNRAFPLYFVQPMKAKKYAFSDEFAAYIVGEHSDTQIKDFMKVLYGFESEGFKYEPKESEDTIPDKTVDTNNDGHKQYDSDRRMSERDSQLQNYNENDIHNNRVEHDDEPDEIVENHIVKHRDWTVTEDDIKDVKKYVNSYVMSYFKKNGLQVKTSDGKTTSEYKRMYKMLYHGVSNVIFEDGMFSQDYRWWATDIYPQSSQHTLIEVLPIYFEDKGIKLIQFNV